MELDGGNFFCRLAAPTGCAKPVHETKAGSGSGRVVALAWRDGEGGEREGKMASACPLGGDQFSSVFQFFQGLQSHEFV